MKKLHFFIHPLSIMVVGLGILFMIPAMTIWQTTTTWKSGTSKTIITPEKAMWMAGYGSRTQPAQGKYGDLWLKILALEDQNGNQVLLITSDILGFPKKTIWQYMGPNLSKIRPDKSAGYPEQLTYPFRSCSRRCLIWHISDRWGAAGTHFNLQQKPGGDGDSTSRSGTGKHGAIQDLPW